MTQSSELREFYENYYNDDVSRKREITARQTVSHIASLRKGTPLGSILDIGAGDGAVIAEIDRRKMATEMHAVEISRSGIERINKRKLRTLKSVQGFDGYKLPFPDDTFDTALLIHVLEHVEHERLLLKEISRVARRCYIEVPLEHTFRLQRSMTISKPFGHINYYTLRTFENILDTSQLKPISIATFAHSREYETFLAGQTMGAVKHSIRSTTLKIAPSLATSLFAYLGAAFCARKTVD
jgi:ubiquinone/menaquinone biosynthesis C-methylase UbiE